MKIYRISQNLEYRKERKENLNKSLKYIDKAAKMNNTKIYKIAYNSTDTIKDEDIPKADALATYVESLQIYLKENPSLKKKYIQLIENLPSPRKIELDFSFEECKILFDTVSYLWRKITKQDLITETKIKHAPESFLGNYWLVKNGILLQGLNHYGIIKQNANLICSLLNINGLALQHYLCGQPSELIDFIIRNGGVRMFVRKDKKAFFQMSEETYAKWGKHKIKKFDFTAKIVKVIDSKLKYTGWQNGISILL